MDPEIKIDRRIRKTKQAIRQAVVKLLSDQHLESITITQVAAGRCESENILQLL